MHSPHSDSGHESDAVDGSNNSGSGGASIDDNLLAHNKSVLSTNSANSYISSSYSSSSGRVQSTPASSGDASSFASRVLSGVEARTREQQRSPVVPPEPDVDEVATEGRGNRHEGYIYRRTEELQRAQAARLRDARRLAAEEASEWEDRLGYGSSSPTRGPLSLNGEY